MPSHSHSHSLVRRKKRLRGINPLPFGIDFLHMWYYQLAMTTVSLKIPDDLISRLDAVARARQTSRSALFREALEEKLQAAARKVPPSLYERSADLCGSGASGMGDLASHARHLDGFGS